MIEDKKFNSEIVTAFNDKLEWYNTVQIPALLNEYVSMHSLVENLLSTLINKGALSADPYKNDKKISCIKPIETSHFLENDKASVVGTRLSDYEMMLDFICNYFTFSIANLTQDKIKALMTFNEGFSWESVSTTSKSNNTRGLAECLMSIRQGSDSFASDLINTNLSSSAKTMKNITAILKDLLNLQKDLYKIGVRKDILEHPSFSDADYASKSTMEAKIKSLYKDIEGKRPFHDDLVDEIIEETIGPNKAQLQKELFKKYEVPNTQKKQKKPAKVDTHALIMEAVHALSAMGSQILQAHEKICENSELLENSKMTAWQKFLVELRKAFNIKTKPITYKIVITDSLTQVKHSEQLNFSEFSVSVGRRGKIYNSFASTESSSYQKLSQKNEDAILEYVTKQIAECQKMLMQMTALDEFFKTQTPAKDRSKVKGVKMELTAIQNTIVKTNQRKSDYISVVEEAHQMELLGISNEL